MSDVTEALEAMRAQRERLANVPDRSRDTVQQEADVLAARALAAITELLAERRED